MKKIIIGSAVAAVLGSISGNANAALATNAVLNFDDSYADRICSFGAHPGFPSGCNGNVFVDVTSGSYFAMDTNGDGQWTDGTQSAGFQTHKDANGNWLPEYTTLPNERTGMNAGTTGITLGTGGQGAGSATYDMTDPLAPVLTSFTTGDMDAGWGFFGAAGWHTTTDADGVTVASAAGNTATLDMSGWTVFWNGGDINMGTGAAATVTCGVDCGEGDTFTLDYDAVVPSGGFAGVAYALHLEGTIGAGTAAVPVPAAVWLFGSGLVGLAGVARRRKAA